MRFTAPHAIAAFSLLHLVVTAAAADAPVAGDAQELARWVMTYHRDPRPDELVARVRQMVEFKTLRTDRPEANEVFLAKVMEANPGKVAEWLESLRDLAPEDAAVVHRAARLSQTREGAQWLERNGLADVAASPLPPLLAGGPMVTEPFHLDQLWEWFFATGDDAPVRQVIGCFALAPADPRDGEQLPGPPDDAADVAAAARFRLARPAIWSTTALAIQDDRVFEILQAVAAEGRVPPRGQAWLERALAVVTDQRERRKAEGGPPGQ